MIKKRNVGHAFSDHVFEERIKRKRGFSNTNFSGVLRLFPLLILCVVFIFLVLRLFTLQVVRASYYSRLSDENRIRTILLPAPRGIILDRQGNALVRNTPAFSILRNNKIEWLGQDEALSRVSKGESILATVKREYIHKDIFSHVVGYVGQVNSDEILLPDFKNYGLSDFTGRMGLEEQYEKLLHGQNGRQLYEVNAKGEKIRLLGEQAPIPGSVLRTTLDTDIQKAAVLAMKDIERGAVIVSDPRDGSILALFSKPSFDPNLFTRESSYESTGEYVKKEDILLDDEKFPLLNRAIAGIYPPGSTYKIITSLAALSERKISENTEFEDTGVLSIGGSNFGTWNYLESGRKEGSMDVRRALTRSNDIFFYQAARKLGVDKLSEWSHKLGLGDKTGIDIPGEVKGTVPNPKWKEEQVEEQWYLGDTINMSIGQGFLQTTPMQVNWYTQFIANGGRFYNPHLIQGKARIVREDLATKTNIGIIKDGMRGACQPGGTGYPLFNFKVKNSKLKVDDLDYEKDSSAGANMVHVTMGCKTGTSESHGYEAEPHAWFTVFAPFYNPEIVITVLAENGGEGSRVAAPVARDILKAYFEKKNY
ncbi:MAG: penicillin-binding protein 2 [Candidatus Levybacteria bacterium]|nr:penicillin-binding protein 2 [Candidatus Levybacteria bacterium]